MGNYAAACETPERIEEEAQHLRRLAFKALKYFGIASECYEELALDFGISQPGEHELMLKRFHRRLMKRFHPDVRSWIGYTDKAPSLDEVKRAYETRNLNWLVWADIEYGISSLAPVEQIGLLETTIDEFAGAIRRTRASYRQLQQGAGETISWKRVNEYRVKV
jgi:hypothetical protein